ncbi:hypothetical protein [Cyanobium sp. Morenito 9A2]|nr:hypothetical protein [Cyanobium sp. Morenito 9A2]
MSDGLFRPDALQAACCQRLGQGRVWMLPGDAVVQGLKVRLLA